MSLVLRKKCQNLLDGVGLSMYHVQVDEGNKHLQIAGECGQVLCTIQGIRLSRVAPNSTEIDLALELFDAFLAKHTDTFKWFISAKQRADQSSIPKHVEGLENVKVEKQSYRDYWELTFKPADMFNVVIDVRSTGQVSIPARTIDLNSEEAKDRLGGALTISEINAVYGWLDACDEYNQAATDKAHWLSRLNSCEI